MIKDNKLTVNHGGYNTIIGNVYDSAGIYAESGGLKIASQNGDIQVGQPGGTYNLKVIGNANVSNEVYIQNKAIYNEINELRNYISALVTKLQKGCSDAGCSTVDYDVNVIGKVISGELNNYSKCIIYLDGFGSYYRDLRGSICSRYFYNDGYNPADTADKRRPEFR